MITLQKELEVALDKAAENAKKSNHKLFTPEHYLMAMLEIESFKNAITEAGGQIDKMKEELDYYLTRKRKPNK